VRRYFVIAVLLGLAVPAFAVDRFVGTWKLNTQKSTGPEPAVELRLVCKDEGAGQLIMLTTPTNDEKPGGSPYKSPVVQEFSLLFKGGTGKVLRGRSYTGVIGKPVTSNTQDFQLMINSDPAVHIRSVLSADGKTMTSTRTVMMGPSKPGTYSEIWEKQ
jgi:hypothetical protein